jgi:hypothetical protein
VSSLRRYVLMAERDAVAQAARRGLIGPGPADELLADIDTRLLALDSSGEERR